MKMLFLKLNDFIDIFEYSKVSKFENSFDFLSVPMYRIHKAGNKSIHKYSKRLKKDKIKYSLRIRIKKVITKDALDLPRSWKRKKL